jgi:hypothetical protein
MARLLWLHEGTKSDHKECYLHSDEHMEKRPKHRASMRNDQFSFLHMRFFLTATYGIIVLTLYNFINQIF